MAAGGAVLFLAHTKWYLCAAEESTPVKQMQEFERTY